MVVRIVCAHLAQAANLALTEAGAAPLEGVLSGEVTVDLVKRRVGAVGAYASELVRADPGAVKFSECSAFSPCRLGCLSVQNPFGSSEAWDARNRAVWSVLAPWLQKVEGVNEIVRVFAAAEALEPGAHTKPPRFEFRCIDAVIYRAIHRQSVFAGTQPRGRYVPFAEELRGACAAFERKTGRPVWMAPEMKGGPITPRDTPLRWSSSDADDELEVGYRGGKANAFNKKVLYRLRRHIAAVLRAQKRIAEHGLEPARPTKPRRARG